MKLITKFFIIMMALAAIFMGYVHALWLPKMKSQVVSLVEEQYSAHLKATAEGLVPLMLDHRLANVYETLQVHEEDNPHWIQLTLRSVNGNLLYPLDEPQSIDREPMTLILKQNVGFLEPYLAELKLVVDISPVHNEVDQLGQDLGIAFAVIMALFLIGLGVEVEVLVRRPIGKLVNASRALAKGTYSFTITNSRKDEIGELTYYFLEMRSALEKNHIILKNEINLQRRKADDLASRKAESDYKASHDALTGQINRHGFELALYSALCESSEYHEKSVLMYLDLDRFKSVNDSCGHLAGDKLLREISALMKGEVRGQDILGRLGGDEFGVILKSCSLEKAHEIANDIIKRVDNYKFCFGDNSFRIGVSIGIAEYQADILDIESWLQRADKACYMAKKSGRGQAVAYKNMPKMLAS